VGKSLPSARNFRDIGGRPAKGAGRDVAGLPKAAGNVGMRKQMCGKGLEDSPEEAGPAAQQPAEDATEAAAQQTAQGSAADSRIAEAVLAADIRVAQRVTDRSNDLHRSEEAVTFLGETTDHVAQLVIAGHDAALVAEETALATQQATQETAEDAAVDGTEDTVRR
jgi:hypothetical protein